jgi:hypothetical protein
MMSIFGNINRLAFVVAFAVGLLACYLIAPAPKVVVKFPSPWNAGQVVYKDKSDACYMYKAEAVACPRDKTLVKPQPIIEDFPKSAPLYQDGGGKQQRQAAQAG